MAESQEFSELTPQTVDVVGLALSTPRFDAYLAVDGDREYALRQYLWNGRLSKAFLFPLGICEIATRNAIHGALSAVHGPHWVMAPPFWLNEFSAASHARALERLARMAAVRHRPPPGPDDLVAALTFDFWSNLFRDEYAPLWTAQLLSSVFPNLPAGCGRKDVQRLAAEVNELRNRIAHHEPIHDRQDHGAKLGAILAMIGMVSRQVRDFARTHSTVMATVRAPPTRQSRFPGRPLAQMNLRPPPVVGAGAPLDGVVSAMRLARPELALVDPQLPGGPAVLTMSGAMALVADRALGLGGMVDLSELTAGEVVAAYPLAVAELDLRATSGDVMALFFAPAAGLPRPSVVLVRSPTRELVGAILRPDVRL